MGGCALACVSVHTRYRDRLIARRGDGDCVQIRVDRYMSGREETTERSIANAQAGVDTVYTV